MACDISMSEAPAPRPLAGYIPRNAIDHMNPFFLKSHHSHSHGHHHHHNHSHHNHTQITSTSPRQTYSTSTHTTKDTPSPQTSSSGDSSPTSTSSSQAQFLQTPVPRRLSVQTDASTVSYNTPPATPPLALRPPTAAEPVAWCTARARIPTPDGSEYFLHIYENSKDKKEHLAFVFGDAIRSQSLDRAQPGETELDRVKRGAYVGRLRSTVSADEEAAAAASSSSSVLASQTTSTTTKTTIKSTDQEDTLMETVEQTTTVYTVAHPVSEAPSRLVNPLVRIHSECFTGEIGHSARCDCGEQLDEAIRLMKAEGSGVVVYLRQEGRGIGLGEKLRAYNLQDLGYDTVMANLMLNHGADERTYEVAQGILEDLGLDRIRLLTNNPDKIEQIEKESLIKVVERVPMMPKSWEAIEQGLEAQLEVKEGAVENKIVRGKELDKYLKVKVERMRHMIPVPSKMTSTSSSSSSSPSP